MITVTFVLSLLAILCFGNAKSQNLVLTNDDGWATAMIRAQFNSLEDAGYEVSPMLCCF